MTGFGRGYCVIPLSSSEKELEFLRNQAHVLQAQLNQIRTRIRGVKTKKEVHHARI
jgi:prefoldin subunit 5